MRTITVVGAKIAAAREQAGLTQPLLAARIGVDRTTLAHWEIGRRSPNVLAFKALCKALGCKADDLQAVGDDDAA